MKLLKLEIGDLPKEKQFRSLHAGFKVEFHSLDTKGIKAMESFSPFCFAGLNGSGKSNVLEALSAIFFHLESCVAKFKPKSFATHFRANECNPDAFTLEYLIGQHNSKPYALAYFDKIIIKKEMGKAPLMWRQSFPFSKEQELIQVSLEPKTDLREPQAAEGKEYLPQIIVGYSSGENEILSLPFRKSRLINFDKYREDYIKGYKYEEPENSLIYIDAEMSQAVLLACLLYEDEETLKPLRKELGIVGLRSFRMNLNVQSLFINKKGNETTYVPILQHIPDLIDNLKKCASSWQELKEVKLNNDKRIDNVLVLDFFVDEKTKQAFKAHFTTSFDLFRFFQVLYELNSNVISESIKEEVYKSKGFYTDGKLPEGSPDENVFYFLDYLILKDIEGETEPKPLLLREFSDGEHQFLHTMGICLMLKDRKSILLLDEPETHFNPSWRSKFIKILDDSIKTGSIEDGKNLNVHLLKDILLTSHSPFIISDCVPDNVILFKRGNEGKVIPKTARELEFNTYGASVDLILQEIFGMAHSISEHALEEIRVLLRKRTIEPIIEGTKRFGESYEKGFLYERIEELKANKKKKAKK
jgi:restriction system-associated AAA family ATPase